MGEKIQPRAIEAAASAAAISLRDMNRLLNSNATQTSRGRGSSLSHGNGTPKHFGRIIRTKRALSKVRSKLALMKRIAGSLFICAGIILALSFGILVALCQGKAGSSQSNSLGDPMRGVLWGLAWLKTALYMSIAIVFMAYNWSSLLSRFSPLSVEDSHCSLPQLRGRKSTSSAPKAGYASSRRGNSTVKGSHFNRQNPSKIHNGHWTPTGRTVEFVRTSKSQLQSTASNDADDLKTSRISPLERTRTPSVHIRLKHKNSSQVEKVGTHRRYCSHDVNLGLFPYKTDVNLKRLYRRTIPITRGIHKDPSGQKRKVFVFPSIDHSSQKLATSSPTMKALTLDEDIIKKRLDENRENKEYKNRPSGPIPLAMMARHRSKDVKSSSNTADPNQILPSQQLEEERTTGVKNMSPLHKLIVPEFIPTPLTLPSPRASR